MPRRVDANQAEIVAALRKAGCRVLDLHEVGKGCPDLLVLCRGALFLLEVKTKKGRLTSAEVKFITEWREEARGPIYVVRDVSAAFRAVGIVEA